MVLDVQINEPPPLRADSEGVVRIGGTRVTLDSVVAAFDRGCTAEEIMLKYPSLALGDIYAAISFYLHHREEVEAYLTDQQQQSAEVRRQIESLCPPDNLRERLLARHSRKP